MKIGQISRRRQAAMFIDIMLTSFDENYNQMCDIFFNKLIKLNTFVGQLERYKYIKTNKNKFLGINFDNVMMFKHPTKKLLFCIHIDTNYYSTDLHVYNIIHDYELSLRSKMFSGYRPKKTTIYKFYTYVLNQDILDYMNYITEYFNDGQVKLENKHINIEE